MVLGVFLMGALSTTSEAVSQGLVGFVDFERVVDEYKQTEAIKSGMRKEMDAKLDIIRKKEEDLREREEELQFLNQNSPQYAAKVIELSTERFRLRAEAEQLEKAWNRKVVQAYRDIVDAIQREIELMGKERGYLAIHRIGGGDITGSEADEQEVVFKLRFRRVLYHDVSLDITSDVIERLNQ